MSKERYIAIYQGDPLPKESARMRYTATKGERLTGVLIHGTFVNVGLSLNGRTELLCAGMEGETSQDIEPDKRVFVFDEPIREVHAVVTRLKEQAIILNQEPIGVYLRVQQR